MSLIQDALKRKAEEIPESVPQPMPEMKPESTGKPETLKEPKPFLIALIVLLVIALLVALGGLAFSLIHSATSVKPAKVQETQSATPVVETPPELPSVPSAPPPTVEISEPTVEIPEPTATTPVDSESIVIEPPVFKEWPELKLTGIASSGTQRIAIINSKMLTVGRRIGEVTVREVHEAQAIVEFRGERRVLYVDE